jgi:hypothetical protein
MDKSDVWTTPAIGIGIGIVLPKNKYFGPFVAKLFVLHHGLYHQIIE